VCIPLAYLHCLFQISPATADAFTRPGATILAIRRMRALFGHGVCSDLARAQFSVPSKAIGNLLGRRTLRCPSDCGAAAIDIAPADFVASVCENSPPGHTGGAAHRCRLMRSASAHFRPLVRVPSRPAGRARGLWIARLWRSGAKVFGFAGVRVFGPGLKPCGARLSFLFGPAVRCACF